MIGGLELGPGEEILTSDEEHPGPAGRAAAARELRGVAIREVPLARGRRRRRPAHAPGRLLARRLDERALAPAELAELDVPVLLDGAQGVGAVPVDVHALGCDAYAGAGQKWLCGPDGTGMLYVSPALRERLQVARRGYRQPGRPERGPAGAAARGRAALRLAVAERRGGRLRAGGDEVLESAGWTAVHERARTLAARLAELLAERGHRGRRHAARARSSPSRAPTPKPSARGSPRAV